MPIPTGQRDEQCQQNALRNCIYIAIIQYFVRPPPSQKLTLFTVAWADRKIYDHSEKKSISISQLRTLQNQCFAAWDGFEYVFGARINESWKRVK